MTTSRAVFSAVILVTAAVGFAGPAYAEPDDLDGAYVYSDGISTQQWVATPCGNACINITASPAAGKPGFSGQATMFRGWTLTVEGLPDVTGSGHTSSPTEACGQPPQAYDTFNFTLTKV